MNLQFDLGEDQRKSLSLRDGENIWYCIPYDLKYDAEDKKAVEGYTEGNQYFVVTDYRMIVLDGCVIESEYALSRCTEIKCEPKAGCGMVTALYDGERILAVRFSMRHIIRFSYVARGAGLLAENKKVRITSSEYEKYCAKCHRALPGTRECPRCGKRGASFKKFWDICRDYKWKLFAISGILILGSMASILVPMIQRQFIDTVLLDKNGDVRDVAAVILLLLFLTALQIAMNVIRNWWCVSLGSRISMDLRTKLYTKIQILSLSFIQKRKPGELMNRIAGDTNFVRFFMEDVFGGMFHALFVMIGSILLMLTISVEMTVYTASLIGFVAVFTRLFWKHIRRIFHMQWMKDDSLRSGLQDVISGMRVVKAFGKEEEESAKFYRLSDEFAKTQKRNETFWAVFFPILVFIMGLGSYIAIFFGGLDVLSGKMTIGELTQFAAYTGYLYGPLGWMTSLPRKVMRLITSLNRIYDVLDEEPQIQDSSSSIEMSLSGDIDFQDISFGYNSYEPVLENVSFHVKQGEMIGLVGASGTGKSTLINLMMRLYDVDSGRITVDGTDLRNIRQSSLHKGIGVVLQETFLFSGTILNNLKFAKQDASFEEVIRAAKAANAHDFICKMSDGYNTYVGEHGYTLSGGERQRIAIARAILNNPKLLILDEATSALDTESEYLIQQALNRLVEGRTTFAIAHRLSTLRNADRLVVIDGHAIAEIGTHNELLEKKGIYYGLVTAQLEMAKVEHA